MLRGESCPLGRLDVDRVVVEEEHSVPGDREPGCDGVEDGGVRLDQAELEGEEAKSEGVGQRDPLVVGRPLERIHVREEGRRDARLHLVDEFERSLEGRIGPAAEFLQERGRLEVELPVGHHACGELVGPALPGLEAAYPLAAEPACPQRLVAVDAAQCPHGGHPAGPNQHAAQVEQDEVDPVPGHGCDARGCPDES